jgi:hypothetical protein
MLELARLLSLAGFVALGLRLRRTEGAARRRALNRFLTYALGLSVLVAVTQVDDWPFTTYTLAAFRPRVAAPICLMEWTASDAEGREWRLDPYTWSPVFESTLQNWFDHQFSELTPSQKETTLAFLLARAEDARVRLAAGRPIGYDRLLGAGLSAPYWWLLPRALAVPPTPYLKLRTYEACRIPLEMRTGTGRVQRTIKAEYPL